jgi:hypothetical protein
MAQNSKRNLGSSPPNTRKRRRPKGHRRGTKPIAEYGAFLSPHESLTHKNVGECQFLKAARQKMENWTIKRVTSAQKIIKKYCFFRFENISLVL